MNKEAKILIGLTIATIAVLIAGVFLFTKKQNAQTELETKTVDESLIIGKNPFVKGSENPKVTIVEFGDFQCPACGASFPITQELIKLYGDKIKFVFRHFPLEQHAQAYDAARAAEAANAQGKFWEMHDKLYSTQAAWSEKTDAVAQFEGFAKELNLNMDEFKKAFSEKKFDSNIQAGLTDGLAAGVNSTPTFFINGTKMSGVFSLDQWKKLLDSYLN